MEPDPNPERVTSKESFLKFLVELREDLKASRDAEARNPSSRFGPRARGWENLQLDSFLEAMHQWADDMGDLLPSSANWQTFARMFIAGKGYE